MKHTQTSQILFKEWWKNTNSGGKVRDYIRYAEGENLLSPAELSDIVPNAKLWRRSLVKPNEFYETSFKPEVSWFTICDIFKTKTIYIETATVVSLEQSPNSEDSGDSTPTRHIVSRDLFTS